MFKNVRRGKKIYKKNVHTMSVNFSCDVGLMRKWYPCCLYTFLVISS